jgi:hypothetical protein
MLLLMLFLFAIVSLLVFFLLHGWLGMFLLLLLLTPLGRLLAVFCLFLLRHVYRNDVFAPLLGPLQHLGRVRPLSFSLGVTPPGSMLFVRLFIFVCLWVRQSMLPKLSPFCGRLRWWPLLNSAR